jgi:uncharacterized membrane protein
VAKKSKIKRTHWNWALHQTFEVGLALKALNGLIETLGGILIWFVTPAHGESLIQTFCNHDPTYDCNDFIARHFITMTRDLTSGSKLFACVFLLSHGITKLVLVIALWVGRLWAYPLMIVVFGGFSIYQIFRFTQTHSLGLLLITILDILVVWLTIREYREQLKDREESRTQASS